MPTKRSTVHLRAVLLAIGSGVALAACATSSAVPPATEPGTPMPTRGVMSTDTLTPHAAQPGNPVGQGGTPSQWTTTLNPENGSTVRGTATAQVSATDSTHVSVLLTGGTPGETYPWHVHVGKCGPGAVVGPATAYTPLQVQAGGTAVGDATIPVPLTRGHDYHVNIHKSPSDMGTIIACGDLAVR